jgi:hypothetical protein
MSTPIIEVFVNVGNAVRSQRYFVEIGAIGTENQGAGWGNSTDFQLSESGACPAAKEIFGWN